MANLRAENNARREYLHVSRVVLPVDGGADLESGRKGAKSERRFGTALLPENNAGRLENAGSSPWLNVPSLWSLLPHPSSRPREGAVEAFEPRSPPGR
ncbi:hypothetical protein KM043_007826 [Ampulex compressa]|nr:hypothetical protein KM043_007826 [Ampulex compressa]